MHKGIAGIITSLAVFSSFSSVSVSADEVSQTEKIISYGQSLIGSPDYNNYCQKFVRLCYESAGLYSSTYGIYTAADAADAWLVSDSRDNIPIGACLYFQTSQYGHAAIYTGNNQMVHGVGIVKEEQISEHYWDVFIGWGYQAGKQPSGIVYENEAETAYPSVPYTSVYSDGNDTDVRWSSYGENTSYYTVNIYNVNTGEVAFTQDYSADSSSADIYLPAGNYSACVKAVNADYSNSYSCSNYYNFSVSDSVAGDINHDGVFDIKDMAALGQYLINEMEFDEKTTRRGDFNSDGCVDILDFMEMKQYFVGL